MDLAPQLESMGIEMPRLVPPAIAEARSVIGRALERLARVSVERLARPWAWREREMGDARYCWYRCIEVLDTAAVAVAGAPRPAAARILALTTEARWDLHGLLIGLSDDLLDRDLRGGEWTLRQTLGHVIEVQERYALATMWAVRRSALGSDQPVVRPGPARRPTPDPSPLAPGSIADVRCRIDELTDLTIATLAEIDDERVLAAPAVWAGYEVDARFRLHRMAPHFQEHTVQIEKTLVLLGHDPSEVARLSRLLARAYGRLEGAMVGLSAPDLSALAEVDALAGTL
jgi:hypothetical protein